MRTDLENFFTDVAVGSANEFSYTHTDGVTYTARFLDEGIEFSVDSIEDSDADVVLELEQIPG